ncbi:ABC transporter substrate-binding protein [Alkalihalobacillus oceani]|uniref:ABC transporter substrate-binding protein n=1 Tax=Halalkalibacter oceani TaxID=1653776 RepID=UPI002041A9C9|nr:ABC transporter substrate-binding protein [Halalkalibacter oceani]MCM3762875.1 ABC transporter substrate-binding protein [Halalkalibacter oceani]
MKNRLLSFFVSILVLGGVAVLLSACETGNTSSDEENVQAEGVVQLEFWTFWGSEQRRPIIEKIVDDFNQMQNEIHVKHVYQPWGDIWTKSLAAIAAGNPPDVIIQDINSVRQRAEANQAVNLQPFIEQESEEIQERFYPHLWDAVLYEEEAYALPFNTDTQVLFYNKDMFEEAGLDPDSPPTTWEELEEAAAALDKKNGDQWETIGFYPLWDLGADVWSLNADNGTGWFNEDGEVAIHTPEKVEALNWIVDWQERIGRDTIERYQAEFGSGIADPFVSGLVAMRGQNINNFTSLKEHAGELNFGVAPLPERSEGSGHHSWGGGFVAEIPYGAEHPEASWEFIKYVTDNAPQEFWGANGFDVMANQHANERLAERADLTEEERMVYELAHQNLEWTVLTPVPLTAPDYNSLHNSYIDEILLGRLSPEEGLAKSQEAVEGLVQQHQ